MSKIGQIQELVRNGLYYLTELADDEARDDGFDIYDVEFGVLKGKTSKLAARRKTRGRWSGTGWPADWRCLPDHSNWKGPGHHGLRRPAQGLRKEI
ncbi:MAG: hypothetical protein AABN34_02605 [Acidobacteriota bacterium]